ncbi:MAG: hypothetical protein IKU94_01420 [Bacteroidaceae bacterium]|nr:hypothetical protein [Bacteroidaceae bacterium]
MFQIILKWLARFCIIALLTLVLVLIVAGIILVAKELRDEWEDWRK